MPYVPMLIYSFEMHRKDQNKNISKMWRVVDLGTEIMDELIFFSSNVWVPYSFLKAIYY